MATTSVLITGGAGFFGGILKHRLLELGHEVVSLDLLDDHDQHPRLRTVKADLRDPREVERAFTGQSFDTVFHCAAMLAHDVKDPRALWESNVDGTRILAEAAARHGVRKVVFTSSNCLWGGPLGRPVREDDLPKPIEIYGQSKWEGEKILQSFSDRMEVVILRPPTIIEAGRLGLLSILFEFMDENRTVWVVGSGGNRYQFIYAPDLAEACIKSMQYQGSAVFNVGSDQVKSLREVYEYVIQKAGSKSRVRSLPEGLTLWGMRMAHRLKISPLGPYHYRMIAEDFTFDTTAIKQKTGWAPTLTNEEMLYRSYQYYHDHRSEIEGRQDVSAHRHGAKMGVIRLLKWVS